MPPKQKFGELLLLRHGQSHWNKSGRFTGWVDIALSEQGVQEALAAGKRFASEAVLETADSEILTQSESSLSKVPVPGIDICYVSTLSRSLVTAQVFLAAALRDREAILVDESLDAKTLSSYLGDDSITMYADHRLNERCYGNLQGQSKELAKKHYGQKQVQLWRRSYEGQPPGGESLKQTAQRVLLCFKERILPRLAAGQRVLVCAHGNSLRALVMEIEHLSAQAVVDVEIPTGEVIRYLYHPRNQEGGQTIAKAAAQPEYRSGFSRVK